MTGWHEQTLFDGWAPDLVRPAALWPTVDPGEVGLDEQASWIWPGAVGVAHTPGWAPSGVWQDQEQSAGGWT